MWVVGIDVHGSVGGVEAATAEVADPSPLHEDDCTGLHIPRRSLAPDREAARVPLLSSDGDTLTFPGSKMNSVGCLTL